MSPAEPGSQRENQVQKKETVLGSQGTWHRVWSHLSSPPLDMGRDLASFSPVSPKTETAHGAP